MGDWEQKAFRHGGFTPLYAVKTEVVMGLKITADEYEWFAF
jgi:hypothetical protein